MTRKGYLLAFLGLLLAWLSCGLPPDQQADTGRQDDSKVLLGRYLFYDRRLSFNNTKSCSSCHNPEFAFTDGYHRSLGATADLHQRNAQPLFNLFRQHFFTAADSGITSLEEQMQNPFFSTRIVEMGVTGHETAILQRMASDTLYKRLFAAAFPETKGTIDFPSITKAIAGFLLTLRSESAPYDRYLAGDSNAIPVSARAGKQLFFSAKLSCAKCHGGTDLNTPAGASPATPLLYYHNTGLYNVGDSGGYPAYDQGLYGSTSRLEDRGKFRVPSLRNLAFTAPYWHDGSANTLGEVIDAYAAGGRNITYGMDKGDGRKHPQKAAMIKGFRISDTEKRQLIDFLLSLSDSGFINNPAYGNPFTTDETQVDGKQY
jgi:cytochrome c peroxidase